MFDSAPATCSADGILLPLPLPPANPLSTWPKKVGVDLNGGLEVGQQRADPGG